MNQEAGKNKRKSTGEDEMERADKTQRNDSGSPSVDNSKEDEGHRKLEEKRAYNRKNAARARQRTKEHILELTARAERYASRNEELQRTNDSLMADVKRLTEENQRLRQLVNASSPSNSAVAGGSGALSSLAVAPGGVLPPGLGGPMHNSGPGTTFYYAQPPHPPQTESSGPETFQNPNDSNAARQRGLILQLLQSQGDSRQGLPPGFNPY